MANETGDGLTVIGPGMRGRVSPPGLVVFLVSPDAQLVSEVQRSLEGLGLRLEPLMDVERALMGLAGLQAPAVVVLDSRLPGMTDGRLLATMQETGVQNRCAVALIAEAVSDEWIARLREGVIDDIVPRHADSSTWSTHLNTMQRGYELHRQLELLRETAWMGLERDPVTGVFHREAMMSILFRETDRVQRLRGALAAMLFVLDDFDHWSTELGAAECDKLMRAIADRTGRILRTYDLMGRMGRDEFLIALPGCSTINAVMLAERMRVDVFGEPFAAKNREGEALLVRLSGSFGITASGGRSPVVVLREAEATLAQAAGPDSIKVSRDAVPSGDFWASEPQPVLRRT